MNSISENAQMKFISLIHENIHTWHTDRHILMVTKILLKEPKGISGVLKSYKTNTQAKKNQIKPNHDQQIKIKKQQNMQMPS